MNVQAQDDIDMHYAGFIRDTVKPGDTMAVSDSVSYTAQAHGDPREKTISRFNTVVVARVNKKSITCESSSKWGFFELIPIDGMTGEPMTVKARGMAFKAWQTIQAAKETRS